jgi:Fe-Mn family superoxide dismutase
MSLELPSLPYGFDALEPHIDARTVEIHYTKHHTTYLSNCNKSLEKYPELAGKSIEWLLTNLDKIPEDIRTLVKNNGGGYYNHNLYWENMTSPKADNQPGNKLTAIINAAFNDVVKLKEEMEKTGLGRLGSGYAWLCKKSDNTLIVVSSLNQDCPLTDGLKPLLVVDVWEHAYYLKYQNRRAEYLTNWWNIVNWDIVLKRYES